MTVGGRTIGNATVASMTDFAREAVPASHQANGVPIRIRTRVVTAASCTDNHIGPEPGKLNILIAFIASFSREYVTVALDYCAPGRAAQEIHEARRN